MKTAALAILLLLALPSLAAASPWSLTDRAKVAVVDNPRFIIEPCPDDRAEATASGCTWMTDDAPIYVRPEYANDWTVVYHELGHRFDHEAMSPILRRAFVRARGREYRAWTRIWQERFADSYSYCARNPERLDTGDIGFRPYSNGLHRRLCRLIDEAGLRAGLV